MICARWVRQIVGESNGSLASRVQASLQRHTLQPVIGHRLGDVLSVYRCSTQAATATASQPQPSRRLLGWLGAAVLVPAAAYAVLPREQLNLIVDVPTRLARDVVVALSIVRDYRTTLRSTEPEDTPGAALRACHQRSADRLLRLCFENGGVYIKLGQHIAQLDNLLPEAYVLTMRRHMLNKCPVSSYEEVARIILQDLGAKPEEVFLRFEQQPIASASLAQVHVAYDLAGRKLAVKVQHAGLREGAAADTWTIEFLVWAAKIIFPDFDYAWLAREVRENLPKELDFLQEGANAQRCRAHLETSPLKSSVHVPEIMLDRSSHRVLTMEFIDGVGVTDLEGLQRLRVPPARVAQLVGRVFSEMIFAWGDVHCDPHAANMLVRKKDGRMQLVLLDHGLYRQIDDEFRYEYAGLWHALVFADREGIVRHSAAMHAGDMYQLFVSMLTKKPWDQVVEPGLDRLTNALTAEQRQRVHAYVSQHLPDINALLLRMPRELLLLLKTNDCLRSVDMALGQPVNTLVITARQCTRALAEQRRRSEPGLRSSLASRWDFIKVELRIAMLRAADSWLRLRQLAPVWVRSQAAPRSRHGGG